jgi:excinuclease UvrABC ATPase subunit
MNPALIPSHDFHPQARRSDAPVASVYSDGGFCPVCDGEGVISVTAPDLFTSASALDCEQPCPACGDIEEGEDYV